MTACSSPKTAADFVARGDSHSEKVGASEQAEADYRAALAIDTMNVQAIDGLGKLKMNSPDELELTQALEFFNRAISIDPKYVPAYLHKGQTLAYMHKFSDAVSVFDTALHLSPGNGELFFERGKANVNSGNAAKGLEDFRRSCEFGFLQGCEIVKKFK